MMKFGGGRDLWAVGSPSSANKSLMSKHNLPNGGKVCWFCVCIYLVLLFFQPNSILTITLPFLAFKGTIYDICNIYLEVY